MRHVELRSVLGQSETADAWSASKTSSKIFVRQIQYFILHITHYRMVHE